MISRLVKHRKLIIGSGSSYKNKPPKFPGFIFMPDWSLTSKKFINRFNTVCYV